MVRVFALLACLAWGQSWAITQYVQRDCANNGDGTAQTCAASAAAVGAFNVATSLTLASGNTAYFCGQYNTSWNPGAVSFTSGRQIISGACPGNPGTTNSSFIAYGGGSRLHLQVEDFTATGGATFINFTGSATSTNSDIIVRRITCTDLTNACVQMAPIADTTFGYSEIYDITCTNVGTGGADDGITYGTAGDGLGDHPLGACVSGIPVAQGVGAASGLITNVLIHDIECASSGLVGRYCVSIYPPDNLTTGGRGRFIKIYNVNQTGTARFPMINLTNDVDDTEVYGNTCTGTQGGAIIHTGGQGATVLAFTDRTWVHDNILECRSIIDQNNPADASGLYPDEGSESGLWERNSTHGNAVSGIYFNDANSHTFRSNVTWGNGDNALNLHGVSDSNLFQHNSFFCDSDVAASGIAPQGRDCVQVDNTVVTGPTLTSNNIVCDTGVPKCVDTDTAPAAETYNSIYGGVIRVEGFTPHATDKSADPDMVGGLSVENSAGFCLASTSALIGQGTYIGAYVLDFNGHAFANPPNIGALSACRGRRPAATRRARN